MSDPPPRNKRAKKEAKKNPKKDKATVGNVELRAMKNETFTDYYSRQLPGIFTSEVEECLRTPLPVTWRFAGHDARAKSLRAAMESSLLSEMQTAHSTAPHALPWYPDRLAWQFDVSRAQLRGKDWQGADAPGGAGRSDAVKAFHAWLMREQDLGNIHRQEAVSMVPPLLLDVQPGMAVLDTCASPGSKAQQLIEMLSVPAQLGESTALKASSGDGAASTSGHVSGLLIANDADLVRCHLLASRAGRLNSPSLMVTNHDARLIPEALGDTEGGGRPLRFDRVLCDVPCTGDGTLRKNPLIWKRWVAGPGNMLHSLQLQIACKGVRLLKVGGRLAYSTCSLNPIENEAVVAQVLETFGSECLRLVDIRQQLPGLQRRAGISSWAVWHRGQWHDTWQSVVDRFPTKCPKLEKLFAPPAASKPLAEGGLGLERCMRLLPHDQDCGGFFIAIFEKIGTHAADAGALPEDTPEVCVAEGSSVMPEALSTNYDPDKAGSKRKGSGGQEAGTVDEGAASSSGAAAGRGDDTSEGTRARMKVKGPTEQTKEANTVMWTEMARQMALLHAHGGHTQEAVVAAATNGSYAPLFTPEGCLIEALSAFYGLDGAFPGHRLVVRSPTARSLLLVADEVLALLSADTCGGLRCVNTGVRIFEREEAKGCSCAYRVCQDGLPHILPHMSKQRVVCSVEAAAQLLRCKQSISKEELASKPECAELVASLGSVQPGTVVVSCEVSEKWSHSTATISFVTLYTASGGIAPMVKALERQALLFRMGMTPGASEEASNEAATAGDSERDGTDGTGDAL